MSGFDLFVLGSFPVHGGTCSLATDEGVVRFEQSVGRHMHPLAWLFSTAALSAGLYGAATGWQYTAGTGELIGWPAFVAMGAVAPSIAVGRILVYRAHGFTGADVIPLADVESVRVTTTDVRWYFKTRKTVPVVLVGYRDDGTPRKRRVMLSPRFDDADVDRVVRTFEDVGVTVEVEGAVRELLG